MPTRILKDTDLIYDSETGKCLVVVLYNDNGDFVGINYENFFNKINFTTQKDIHKNPDFHECLKESFRKNGLTDQKEFKKTVCAFKKIIEGCYLECKAKDDIYDNCMFRVSIRKSKKNHEWRVSPNTSHLNFTCTCGIAPKLLNTDNSFKQIEHRSSESGKRDLEAPMKKIVNYHKSLKKFSFEKPGTLSFGILRQYISEELIRQVDISKRFKVQVRRTGGSKQSDYAFLECFKSDNKYKTCKFKVSFKRNKATNVWTLDEASTRKVFDCSCENNTDMNDENGDIIKDEIPRLELNSMKRFHANHAPKTRPQSEKGGLLEEEESNFFADSDLANNNKENDQIAEDAINELTKGIVDENNIESNNKLSNSGFSDASVQNLLKAAIEVVQNKQTQNGGDKRESHTDNVFEEQHLEELENDEHLTTNFNGSKKRHASDSAEKNNNIKKQRYENRNDAHFDYYEVLHEIIFFTKDAISKNELSDILHQELAKHKINRKFDCSLKSKSKEFTNGLYLSCPKKCGFKAVFRRSKNSPWAVYGKSRVGSYKCNCVSPFDDLSKDNNDKVPVIG